MMLTIEQRLQTPPPYSVPTVVNKSFSFPSASIPQGLPLSYASQAQGVMELLNTCLDYIRAVQGQAAADRAVGNSTWSGAQAFGTTVMQGVSTMELTNSAGFLQASPLEQFGLLAQQYLMGNVQREVITAVASELGIDTSKLTLGEIADMALQGLGVKSGAGTAGRTLSSAAGGAIEGGSESSIGSLAGKFMGAAGAAYCAYGLFKNFGKSDPVTGAVQGASVGGYLGSVIPGVGTAIGALVGGVVGAVMGLFHTGKHKDQIARDRVRNVLQQGGMIDENYCLTLADGSKYDIGKDGGFELQSTDGSLRHAYDVDFKDPRAAKVVGFVNPLMAVLTAGNKKLQSDFTGYLVNAALSNTQDIQGAKDNVLTFYRQSGISAPQLQQTLQSMLQQGVISQSEFAAYMGGVQSLTASVNGRKTAATS